MWRKLKKKFSKVLKMTTRNNNSNSQKENKGDFKIYSTALADIDFFFKFQTTKSQSRKT